MKRLLFFIATFLFTVCYSNYSRSQEVSDVLTIDSVNGGYIYQRVVDVEGVSKDEIYKRIKNWIIDNLKSPVNYNYFDDDKHESISTTISFVTKQTTGFIEFKLNINIKEGKYRILAKSFVFMRGGEGKPYNYKKSNRMLNQDFVEGFKPIMTAIKKAARGEIKSNNDNW